MIKNKVPNTKEDIKTFKEEIFYQFHIFFENVSDQLKQVAKGVATINEKLERFREEIKDEIAQKHEILFHIIDKIIEK